MARLRAEDGCPWDRRQDRQSLKGYIVEEAYEVCEAIDGGDATALRDELGDLLFQVVFQAQIGAENGEFDMDGVVDAISDKMERRHPHVFGDGGPISADEENQGWEAMKAAERADKGVLFGVPKALPALHKARRLTDKAAAVGFEWPSAQGAWDKFDEEMGELREAAADGDPDAIRHELGDVLFTLVNIARWLGVEPEDALQQTNARFVRRFGHVESELRAQGKPVHSATLEEMDALWNDAKAREKLLAERGS